MDHIADKPDPLAGLPFADRVNTVSMAHLRQWLRLGLHDLRVAGWVSVAYGMIFVLGGFAVTYGLVLVGMPYLITPMIGGFLLVAPLLAMGFYEISDRIADGRPVTFSAALLAFRRNGFHIMTAGLVLMLYLMIWARIAVLVFALFFPYQSMSLQGFLEQAVTMQGLGFLAVGSAVGFVMAAFAFVTNVIALPMMLNERTDVFSAAAASAMTVMRNPGPLAAWAAIIAVSVIGAAVLGFVGLAVVLPVIGHASRHAYRSLMKV